jgi:hypothetical protein
MLTGIFISTFGIYEFSESPGPLELTGRRLQPIASLTVCPLCRLYKVNEIASLSFSCKINCIHRLLHCTCKLSLPKSGYKQRKKRVLSVGQIWQSSNCFSAGLTGGGYGGCSPGAHSLGGPEIQGPHFLQCMSSNDLTFQFIVLIYQNSKK